MTEWGQRLAAASMFLIAVGVNLMMWIGHLPQPHADGVFRFLGFAVLLLAAGINLMVWGSD